MNNVLKTDAEPVPGIDVVVAKVANKRYFPKLDLSKGYWQMLIVEASKEKTAFSCSKELFQFWYMPFGLKTAAAVFTRLMRRVLHGVPHVELYIEAILVATDTWDEHLQVLEKLLTRVEDAGFTIRSTKSQLEYNAVEFWGHKLGMGKFQP